MKATTINLRVSDGLKNRLEEFGIEKNMSISLITRSILEEYFNEDKFNDDENQDIISSIRFLKLIVWLYEKRTDSNSYKNKLEYTIFLQTIIEVRGHRKIRAELKFEFEKVFKEILEISNYSDINMGYFKFSQDINPDGFNYQLLENFINECGN